MMEALLKLVETTVKESKLYDLSRGMEGKITDVKELDKPIAKEISESKEYKTIDEALENASDAEKTIYGDAELKKGEVNGRESLQRSDINYDEKDEFGRTNLERMEQGLAPLKDGKPIELHHIGQDMDSPLAELTKDEHMRNGNDTILHDKQKESDIDRGEFKKEKEEYWKARAEQIRDERGE
ncbi:HNH/ENDO VII family nuclease [Clostridium sp.]|uniref:HNH/ENDO VII family nuclease n=1 Tax=Clostridium sp. TaxID=1506 RepID=UPI003D6CB6A6